MSTLLAEASSKHEVVQMSSQLDRNSRRSHITDVIAKRDLKRMFVEARETSVSGPLWNVFPPTEVLRSAVHRHCVRAAAAVFYHVGLKYDRLPWSLFHLLVDPVAEKAQALLDIAPCLRDAFSADYFQRYSTAEMLIGEQSFQTLSACAMLIHTNTYRTERKHSCNSRRLAHRVQAKPYGLADLMVSHMAFPGPEYLHDEDAGARGARRHTKRGVGRPGKTSKKKRRRIVSSVQQAEQPQLRRHGGGGGAWRAFQHFAHPGKFSGTSMRDLSHRYRALSAEDKAWYAEVGRLGLHVAKEEDDTEAEENDEHKFKISSKL